MKKILSLKEGSFPGSAKCMQVVKFYSEGKMENYKGIE